MDETTRRLDTGSCDVGARKDPRRGDPLTDARVLNELEHRLFNRGIEPVRLGRYLVLDCVGVGGFGSVYLAHDPQLDRRVAIKLLDSDISDSARWGALLAEAKALAHFSHPNVVAIHDVISARATTATTSSRTSAPLPRPIRPEIFLVMEFVDGPTLEQWCLRTTPSTQQVMDVFAQAADGLAAAHEAGIVHGDFKPANVIVGSDGRVRILDFGLARVAGGQPAAGATRNGSLVGTPAYMAPEQLAGGPANEACDQYAFAVALHEALHGSRPILGRATEGDEGLEDASGPTPTIRPAVPVSVAAVLQRALAVDPRDRFNSMRELRTALVRRNNKRWRRKVLAVGSVCIAAVASLVLASVSAPTRVTAACERAHGWLRPQWNDEDRSRIRERFETTASSAEWTRVEASLDNYIGRLNRSWRSICNGQHGEKHRPQHAGTGARMRCLERRRDRFDSFMRALMEADSVVLARAADMARELPSVDACLSFADGDGTAAPGDANGDVPLSIEIDLMRIDALREAGRLSEQLALARDVVGRARDVESESLRATALLALGQAQRAAEQEQDAEATLGEALEAAERAGSSDVAIQVMAELIRTLATQGRHSAADGILHAARARVARGDIGDVAASWLSFQAGVLRLEQLRWSEAIENLERGLALTEAVYGHRTLHAARFYNSLGNGWFGVGELDRAVAMYERALHLTIANLGDEHPAVAMPLNNLGSAYRQSGDQERATMFHQRAVEVANASVGGGRALALFHGNLAYDLSEAGRFVPAIEQYSRAIELHRRTLSPDEAEIARLRGCRGYLLLGLGRPADALPDLVTAADTQARLGRDLKASLRARDAMAEALSGLGRLDEALVHHRDVLRLRVENLGADHPDVAISYLVLADTWERRGDSKMALVFRQRALAIRTRAFGPSDPSTAFARGAMARSELLAGQVEAAAVSAARAYQDLRLAHGDLHPDLLRPLSVLGEAEFRLGRLDEANTHARQAQRVASATDAGKTSNHFARARGLQ